MANLKTYLQKLFKMSGSQAMPDFSRKAGIITVEDCRNLNYVATANGYIHARFILSASGDWNPRLYVDSQVIFGIVVPASGAQQYIDFFFAVGKGAKVTAYSSHTNTQLALTFVQLVGN